MLHGHFPEFFLRHIPPGSSGTFHTAYSTQDPATMNILHTSDWHLGHSLFGRRRHEEFRNFLSWLLELVRRERVDVLLISGDVFDNAIPGNPAQTLYYDFLREVTSPEEGCRHVVIVAGNHDSPAFIDAPGALLSAMHIHVTGRARTPEEETLLLRSPDGQAELIVSAIPFLRDRDLYRACDGDDPEERESRMAAGMKDHYHRAAAQVRVLRAEHGDIPAVATGHLFAAGGLTVPDDGVRDLRIGSLGQVTADIFPDDFDYVALGHLHLPQKVNGRENIRYSGSPLPMGFDEGSRPKEVCLLSVEGRNVSCRNIAVPVFQRLEKVEGDLPTLERRLEELSQSEESIWTEVVHTGSEPVPDLRDRVEKYAGNGLEILRIRNMRTLAGGLDADPAEEDLEELGVEEVFERRLREAFPERDVTDPALEELRAVFREAEAAARRNEEDSCAF